MNESIKKLIKIPLLITTLLTGSLVSCDRDNGPDINSPAYYINESEKLAIPIEIQLPGNQPNGNTRVATFYAEGVQKYKAKPVAGGFEWAFVAPQADLYDISNKKIGTHSAGPTWQLIGSTTDSIYAQAFTPAKTASSSDPGSIDWLQLKPKDGKLPTGLFTNVAYIQRIATKGGKAPAIQPVSATDIVEVKYSAIYRFTKINL